MLSRFALANLRQVRPFYSLAQRSMVLPPKKDAHFDQSDDMSVRPVLELDKFYSLMLEVELSDERALEYMTFAAKMAQVNFKDQAELMSFRNDFN